MFKKLLTDSAITATAFWVAAVIGLILTPLLIQAYGLTGFGLIILARALLPSGAIGIVDFGIAEIATQVTSAVRITGDWSIARARLWQLSRMTGVLAGFLAIIILFSVNQIIDWFKIPDEMRTQFINLILATALTFPLLFFGLLGEGVIRGFQKFSILRTVEIALSLIYAFAVLVGIWANFAYAWPAWVFLTTFVIKAVIYCVVAYRLLPHGPTEEYNVIIKSYLWERARLLFSARILGNLQHQLPSLLIGFLFGPAAVGIYDAIVRLPKFAKSALGVMCSTLTPVAMRLETLGDRERLQTITVFTISTLPALIIPPMVTTAGLSSEILNLWLGPDFVPYWPWFAAFWIIPALNTIISFQNSYLLIYPEYLRKNNRIAFVQTALQIGLSLALAPWIDQNSFIFGQVIATVFVFLTQIWLGHSFQKPPKQLSYRLYIFLCLSVVVVIIFITVTPVLKLTNVIGVISALLMGTVIMWIITFRWFLNLEGQKILRNIIQIAFARLKFH